MLIISQSGLNTQQQQFAVWNVLAEQGIGASLQHYNPIIDEKLMLVLIFLRNGN